MTESVSPLRDAARALAETKWIAIEDSFDGELRRSVRVVRALVTFHAGDEVRGRMLAAAVKPLAPGELLWMGKHWPEMQAFIVENQLDA